MKKTLLFLILLFCTTVVFAQLPSNKFTESYDFKRGTELVFQDNPDYDAALESFLKEIQQQPKNGYAYYYMAQIYANKEQTGKALECYDHAIAYLRKDKKTLSDAYQLKGSLYLDIDEVEKGIVCLNKAIKAYPQNEEARVYRFSANMQQKEFAKAREDADYLTSHFPNSPYGYHTLARYYSARQMYEKAIESLSYCIKLNELAKYYVERGDNYLSLKKNNEAVEDLVRALELDNDGNVVYSLIDLKDDNRQLAITKIKILQRKYPTDTKYPITLGVMYEKGEEYSQAISEYLNVYNQSGETGITERLAECYLNVGRMDEALYFIEKAVQQDSTNIDALTLKSRILIYNSQFNEAEGVISKMISIDPEKSFSYFLRGRVRYRIKKYQAAVDDYTAAIALNSKFYHAYQSRGKAYQALEEKDKALKDFQMVIDLDTIDGKQNIVPFTYLAMNEPQKAIEAQKQILDTIRSSSNLYNAACLYALMKDTSTAIQYLKEAADSTFICRYQVLSDEDFEDILNQPDFQAFIKQLEDRDQGFDIPSPIDNTTDGKQEMVASEIPFTRQGGVCNVKCQINGLPLSFVFDTGASNVTLSMVEATFMMKNNYLTKNDVIGSQYYMDANGNISEGTVILIKEVKFGDLTLRNIRATVVKNQKAPLLLGQSVLSKLGSVELDNHKEVIRIKH